MTSVLNRGSESFVGYLYDSHPNDVDITTLADGSYVVVWSSSNFYSNGAYIQRYSANGLAIGAAISVDSTAAVETHVSVAALANGGYAVSYLSGSSNYMINRNYTADGTSGSSASGLYADQTSASSLSNGGHAVTYSLSVANGTLGPGVYLDVFNGQNNWSYGHLMNTSGNAAVDPSIAGLDNGTIVAVWTEVSSGTGASNVYTRLFNNAGSALGGVTTVEADSSANRTKPDVVKLSDGYVVTWQEDAAGGDHDIYAQMMSEDGQALGQAFLVSAATVADQTTPSVAALDDGGFVFAWTSNDSDGTGQNIYSRHFDSSGQALSIEERVNTDTAGTQDLARVTGLSGGGYVIVWNDEPIETLSQRVYTPATTLNGAQVLYGTAGADSLDGGSGSDSMYGGSGDDTYFVDTAGDSVVEGVSAGDDTVMSAISYTLGKNVENLTLTGSAALSGTGNALDNVIIGNNGANHLNGGAGDDSINGGNGNDTLYASDGEDFAGGDSGIDTYDASTGTGAAKINLASRSTQNGYTTFLESIENVIGTDFADSITGTNGDNVINGGAGADRMAGGLGDDTYYVDDIGDVVAESADAALGGTDLVISSISYTLGAYVENLTLTGRAALNGSGNALDNVITGNDGNNVLDGKAGNDTLIGRLGDDTYYVDSAGDTVVELVEQGTDTVRATVSYALGQNVENLILIGTANTSATGNGGSNTLTGNSGNNILDGGVGADAMAGGNGNDIYYVDNLGDTVTESSDVTLGGSDQVISTVSFTLGNYLENLTLAGSTNINATGNSLSNLLTGNTGNNILDGKAGADTMTGGLGDDTYVVDVAGDVIVELAGQGNDTVKVGFTYTLGQNLENLVLTGTGNINGTGNADANAITGNAGNNIIDGGAGADVMTGGTGDDTYVVDNVGDVVNDYSNSGNDTILSSVSYTLSGRYVETLQLTGSANINAIGNAQDNRLISNAGNNSLSGGTGADTFVFLLGSHADIITDFTVADNDTIDVSAYHAVSHAVTQSGTSVVIDFGSGNTVTVLHTNVADVTAHTVF